MITRVQVQALDSLCSDPTSLSFVFSGFMAFGLNAASALLRSRSSERHFHCQ